MPRSRFWAERFMTGRCRASGSKKPAPFGAGSCTGNGSEFDAYLQHCAELAIVAERLAEAEGLFCQPGIGQFAAHKEEALLPSRRHRDRPSRTLRAIDQWRARAGRIFVFDTAVQAPLRIELIARQHADAPVGAAAVVDAQV